MLSVQRLLQEMDYVGVRPDFKTFHFLHSVCLEAGFVLQGGRFKEVADRMQMVRGRGTGSRRWQTACRWCGGGVRFKEVADRMQMVRGKRTGSRRWQNACRWCGGRGPGGVVDGGGEDKRLCVGGVGVVMQYGRPRAVPRVLVYVVPPSHPGLRGVIASSCVVQASASLCLSASYSICLWNIPLWTVGPPGLCGRWVPLAWPCRCWPHPPCH